MISIVNILAGLLGSRHGKIMGIVALAGVVFFFIHTLTHKPGRLAKLPAVSMLESVQMMQRLDLLQYESNQVLVLGDPSTLEVMLEKSVADTVKITKELSSLKLELEKDKVGKETVMHGRSLYQLDLDEHNHTADSTEGAYNKMPGTFKAFLKAIKNQSEASIKATYGESVTSSWTSYKAAEGDEGKGRRGKKREERKKAKEAEVALNKAWLDLRKDNFDQLNKSKNTAREKERDFKHSTHQRSLDRYSRQLKSQQDNISEKQNELSDLRSKIENIKKELVEHQGTSGDNYRLKRPKILSVLPTQTDVYLDLKTVDTKIYGDTLIAIVIDSIHYGQVNVLVDSSKYYNISKRSIELQGEANGLYFTVFEQLQVGLQIIQEKVKLQLSSKHFKEEALKKAKSYFEGIYNPLGYKVYFGHLTLPVDSVKVVHATKTSRPLIPKLNDIGKAIEEVKQSLQSRLSNEAQSLGGDAQNIEKSLQRQIASIEKERTKRVRKVKKPVPRPVAKNDTLKGIDVSHFNGTINWKRIEAEGAADFAYAKATQGRGFDDPMFDRNWSDLEQTKIRRGAYHFFVPTDDPREQAEFFIQHVGDLKENDMPPMIDIEDTDMGKVTNAEFQANVLLWLKLVEAHYGVKPIIYTYTPYANQYLTRPEFAQYKLWIAEYTDAPEPHIPNTWEKQGWYMWQYTSRDEIKSVSGYVDCDRLIGKD